MQYLIDFHDKVTEQEITTYFNSFDAKIIKIFNNFSKVYHIETDIEPPGSELVEFSVVDDIDSIKLLSTTIVSDPNYGSIVKDGSQPMMTIENTDNNWWKYFSFRDPDLNADAYTTNRRGQGVTVYVLDSGIQLDHEEFQGQDLENLHSFTDSFEDRKGHGTAIASLIVGNTCGVTNAAVKSVKIFDPGVPTKQSDMVRALDVIYADILDNRRDKCVVNISWGIDRNLYLEDKIQTMINSGIFFVVAAGNNGMPIADVTPAAMPEVLTIGSYNNQLKPSDFSNYTGGNISVAQGPVNSGALDGWAPGEHIWHAVLNNQFGYSSGTSLAAAIHTAALAYNISLDPRCVMMGPVDFAYITTTTLGRNNLLDLSDNRYSSSPNVITTILDVLPTANRGIDFSPHTRVTENSKFALQLFNPTLVDEIVLPDNFPSNWQVYAMGKLYGTAPSIDGRSTVDRYDIQVKAHGTDTYEPRELTIVTLAKDFNRDTESIDDPVLNITLYEFCSVGACITNYDCVDNCFAFYQSCNFIPDGCGKGFNYCSCYQ